MPQNQLEDDKTNQGRVPESRNDDIPESNDEDNKQNNDENQKGIKRVIERGDIHDIQLDENVSDDENNGHYEKKKLEAHDDSK